jgi:hypothetical protein
LIVFVHVFLLANPTNSKSYHPYTIARSFTFRY